VVVEFEIGFGLDHLVQLLAVEFLQFGRDERRRALGVRGQRLRPGVQRLVVAVRGVLVPAHPGVGGDVRHCSHDLLAEFEHVQQRLCVLGDLPLVGFEVVEFRLDCLVGFFPLLVVGVEVFEIPLVLLVDVAALGNRTHAHP
jgi:hypothetical protein